MATVRITLNDGRVLKLSQALCDVLGQAVDDGTGDLRLSQEVREPVYVALKRRGLAVWSRRQGIRLTALGAQVCRHLGGPLELVDVFESEPVESDVPNIAGFSEKRSRAWARKRYEAKTGTREREVEIARERRSPKPFRSRRRAVVWGRRPEAEGALEEVEFAQAPPMVGADEPSRPVVDAALPPDQARRLSLALEHRDLLLQRFEEESALSRPWSLFTRPGRERELARRLAGPQRIIDHHRGRYVEPRDLNESGRWTLGRVRTASDRIRSSPLVRGGWVERELNRVLVAETEWAVARGLRDRHGDAPQRPWWDVALVDPLEVRIRLLEGYAHRLTEVARTRGCARGRLRASEQEELEFLVRRALWVGRQIDDRALGAALDALTDHTRAVVGAAYPHHDAWLIDLLNERSRSGEGA